MTFENDKRMNTVSHYAPRQDAVNRVLLVMLPGAMHGPEDFVRQGFVRAVRKRCLPVDVILADAHADYYLERSIGARLAQDVIRPTRARPHQQIWLMGISLGGMGALICARNHPAEIAGVILLAPYLGNRGRIAEIVRCGGFDIWQSNEIKPQDDEQALLAWLKAYRSVDPGVPAIYLGWGRADRFAPASELLAQRLPAERVAAMQGGHDWKTWTQLWEHFLDQGLFSDCADCDRARVQTAASR
ncbi:MAG: alpha/beta hydrolase-fold protein [Betaproteobacteria bacterium]